MEICAMKELHLNKKDFKLEWYSGSGAGGQHRNKHQNCCRITHIESGLKSNGTANKSRVSNQRDAFLSLSSKVVQWYYNKEEVEKIDLTNLVRNYNKPRNEVHDKGSGLKETYKKVVTDGNINNMIEMRW